MGCVNVEKIVNVTTKFGQHGANVLFVDKQYISILHKRSIEIIKTRRIRMTYYEKIVTAIAARMLIESNMNIAEIAQAVGYDSQSKFATAFKAYFKILPREYRKK